MSNIFQNTTFEGSFRHNGEYRFDEASTLPFQITEGYSKDHRPNLKQLLMSTPCVGDKARVAPGLKPTIFTEQPAGSDEPSAMGRENGPVSWYLECGT